MSAFVARFWLAWISEGTNDIRTWQRFGMAVDSVGLGQAYVLEPLLNHPPLPSLWAASVARWTDGSALEFARLFKLPSVIAEVVTAILLLLAWRARGDVGRGYAAFALYALAFGNALFASFHGNTDALYFAFCLAGAYLIEARQCPFLAGLMLACALNIKLIPILIILPLAACCDDWRKTLRFGVGIAVAALPFIAALASFDPVQREHFIGNVFGYKSYPESWGMELLARTLLAATERSLPEFADLIRRAHDVYFVAGGKLLVLLTALLALWAKLRGTRRPSSYALSAAGFSTLLLFGPGWGVQYLGCVIAPLLATRLRSGLSVAFATGAMALLIYLHFLDRWTPISSEHMPFPAVFSGISAITWMTIFVHAKRALALPQTLPLPQRTSSVQSATSPRAIADGETGPTRDRPLAFESAPDAAPSTPARSTAE